MNREYPTYMNSLNSSFEKEFKEKATKRYIEEMSKMEKVNDFYFDNSFNGIVSKSHKMYKLKDTIHSKDGEREYEFLIEFDESDPSLGIYYGCRVLFPKVLDLPQDQRKDYTDQQVRIIQDEFKIISDPLALVLSNMFIDKNFFKRFRITDNANNGTFWVVWVTLYEEEDIVNVAALSCRTMRRVFGRYIENEEYDLFSSIKEKYDAAIEDKKIKKAGRPKTEKIEVSYSIEAYKALEDAVMIENEKNYRNNAPIVQQKKKERLALIIKTLEDSKVIFRNYNYDYAWQISELSDQDFLYLLKDKNTGYINEKKISRLEHIFIDRNGLRLFDIRHKGDHNISKEAGVLQEKLKEEINFQKN